MSRKPRHSCPFARWILLVASLVLPLSAAVALGAVPRRATTTIAAQSQGSATATCDPGQVALAAGFAAPGFDPTSQDGPLARFASLPSGRDAVATKAFNFDQRGSGELDSYAYCGARRRPPTIESKSISVPPGEYDSVVVECPMGSRAIGGGFGTDKFSKPGPEILTLVSKRSGQRGWKIGGFNIEDSGPGQPGTLTAYTYCKGPGPKLTVKSKDATVSTSLRTIDITCPDGGRVRSGGFDGHFTRSGSGASAAGALTSRRIDHGRGWRTSAISASAPNPATITTYAYCRT
jgi:hypothetical protein